MAACTGRSLISLSLLERERDDLILIPFFPAPLSQAAPPHLPHPTNPPPPRYPTNGLRGSMTARLWTKLAVNATPLIRDRQWGNLISRLQPAAEQTCWNTHMQTHIDHNYHIVQEHMEPWRWKQFSTNLTWTSFRVEIICNTCNFSL